MLRLQSISRPALPALLAVLPLALAPLAGCTGSSSSATAGATASAAAAVSSAAANSAAPSASASAPAGTSPAQPATTASPVATTASPVAAGGGTSPAAPQVFLAEGGDVRGPTAYRPACGGSGCGLSGDGTTALFNMTWTTWNASEAVGAGTEKIDDCNPNCAAGTLHAVAVRVTLSNPVMVCASGKGTWYWTRVTFTWPGGLPAVFSGDNAPANPFNYQDITAQQAKSCS